jgi:ribosomal protein L7/L12
MQNSLAMNSDIKALLTLWLLKTGTNAQEIHTALQIAAASRVMVAEENAGPGRPEETAPAANNIAKFRPASEALSNARKMRQQADAMNSDIKALLTLSLLKIGTSSNEIQTALRLAAASRVPATEERAEPARVEEAAQPEVATASDAETAKQALRNDHLAPISIKEFAAA